MVMGAVRPDVAVFDVNDTLFDLSGIDPLLAQAGLAPSDREVLLARVLRDGFALAVCGTYAPFMDLLSHHLRELMAGRDAGPEAEGQVPRALETLEPFVDVRPALERLRDHRIRAVALTNGGEALARGLLRHAELSGHVEAVYDVAEVLLWKPRPEPYAFVSTQLGVDAERLAMITSHPWDIHGATCAGLVGAWVNRTGAAYPAMMNPPRVEGSSLLEVVEKLAALPD